MENRKKIIEGIIKSLKILGEVKAYQSHAIGIRLTSEEIKEIAEKTGLEAYKIYIKYG